MQHNAWDILQHFSGDVGEFGLFPDQNLGTKTNYCGTSNWGDVANNAYHFRINKINGSTSGYWVWVGSVVTKY